MSKRIIAVDADDTIFDENGAVLEFHNRTYGSAHTLEDYMRPGDYDTYWQVVWGAAEEEVVRRYEAFVQHKLEHNIPPIEGAVAVLQRLKEDYDLVVVTSRDERGVGITYQALAEHYPKLFNDVHFVSLWRQGEKVTKAMICNEIGASYLIDDSYDHCRLAADAGVNALLYGVYGWNQHQPLLPKMVRVKNWQAVAEYFDAQRS